MKEIHLTFHKAVINSPAVAPLAQESVIAGFPSPAQDSFSPEIDKSLTASDGDFVIAYVNGDFTIKQLRLNKDGRKGRLVPWNKQYPDIEIDADDDFRIWGVVTHVVHSVKRGVAHDK